MLGFAQFRAAGRTVRGQAAESASRRGAVLVLAAALLIVVFAFTAFTVDVGYISLTKSRLQVAADAAALAAALHVGQDGAAAESDAVSACAANSAAGSSVELLPESDLEFGIWDEFAGNFVALSSADDPNANAVRATCRLNSARGSAVKLFFAPVLGVSETDLTASAIAMVERNLCGPLVGIESVTITGNPRTDSYRSDEGPYSPSRARSSGSVCSDGPIDVIGNALVRGDANPGRGYETTIIGNAQVTGSTKPRSRPLNLPPVEIGDVEFINDNNLIAGHGRGRGPSRSPLDADRNFSLTHNSSYDLFPGTYYLNNLTLTGQSTLNVSGPTMIYLTGNLETAGGRLANDTGLPGNLKIFMTGGTARIIGNVDLSAVIYAPNTDVTITGTGTLDGAVVGKTLDVQGNGDVHYDESLDLTPDVVLPAKPVLVQ